MAMPLSKFPDPPGSENPQMPTPPARRLSVHMSKSDQRRERNRQAQRKHREYVKQQLEMYDRLRQSLQGPESDINATNISAGLLQVQQHFCPTPSASFDPFISTQSMSPSLFQGIDVDQPKGSQPLEPNVSLYHPFIPSTGYGKGVDSVPSTVHEGYSSSMSSRADDYHTIASDTGFSLGSGGLSPPSELQSNIRVGDRPASGRTLLHQGVIIDSEETVSVLLAHVADVKAQDNEGRTPLHLAAALGYTSIGRLLLMHGAAATVSMADRHGLTALHLAVQNGHVPMVKALVEFGADVNLRF